MKAKALLYGIGTAISLFSANIMVIDGALSPKQWIATAGTALAAGIMAAVNPEKRIGDQFKKGDPAK